MAATLSNNPHVPSPLFELRAVTLARDGNVVLRELTASLPSGAVSVVGPSGSGKSTLLRLLNRLVDPDRGEVLYRATDVRELDVLALRREVCLVPQLPALLEGSAADNVRYGARLAGQEADVPHLLELAGLDGSYAERDGARLSVGEQQRVMIARALALEPAVLLLDEPTSALDEAARDSVEQTLVGLRERLGLSWVLVTHDQAQAERMADWTLALAHGGTIVGEGPTVAAARP